MKTKNQILWLAFVTLYQKEIIEALIKDTDCWAETDDNDGYSAEENSPKKRLLLAEVEDDTQEWEGRSTVMIRDGEDNNIFISESWAEAYDGISTETHKPPHDQVKEIIIRKLTLFVTFN
jgi:hypothetical protein